MHAQGSVNARWIALTRRRAGKWTVVRSNLNEIRSMSTYIPGPWDTFLRALSVDPEWSRAFVARNFRLEERSMPERWKSYDTFDGRTSHADYAAWARAHQPYLNEYVFRPIYGATLAATIDDADEDQCPESFRQDPSFFPYDRDLDLIRVEEVGSFARAVRRNAADVNQAANDWILNGAPDAEWHDLLAERNRKVQIRPTFAALFEDVEDTLESGPGWENRLRDALGLLHLDPGGRGGAPNTHMAAARSGHPAHRCLLPEDVGTGSRPSTFTGDGGQTPKNDRTPIPSR